ncbi:MAG: septum site-determining protein MinC, partial [bacterium]|nr:septum site-determining protein MinC [bacterium]
MENKELISFKGMVDGVRINLSDSAGIFELLEALEERIAGSKAFFGDGDCKIRFGGRLLSTSDKQRLEELLKKILPLCRVSFDSEASKAIPQTDWIVAYKERGKESEEVEQPKAEEPKKEDFISVFRSNRARFYEGTLKEGTTLRSDGHLILLGSVSEGAALIAAGNIIVIGGLYGTAHAGCNGHNGSYIIAMDMHPEGLAIAQVAEEYTYSQPE